MGRLQEYLTSQCMLYGKEQMELLDERDRLETKLHDWDDEISE
jgi:hypothetical protein